MRIIAATNFFATALLSNLLVPAGNLAWAEGFMDDAELSGLFESELAWGRGDVQKAEFVLTPELGVALNDGLQLTIIARFRGDLTDELEPGVPEQRNRSESSRHLFIGDHVDVELREVFIDFEVGDTFLRLGKQQVVWGQADGLKVLDVLNPQSFREFILDDFDDSRIPLWTANAEIPVGDAMLQLLWIPDKTYDDIPQADALFAFTSPLVVPQAPPGLSLGMPITQSKLQRPNAFFRDSDVAASLSAFVGGWDLSLNYAYHYFDRPVIRREISSQGIAVHADYERTHLLGGTFSNVFDDFTLRGEVGYSSDRYFLTDAIGDSDGVVQSGEFSYVLGLDYQGWRDWFVSGQIFQSVMDDHERGVVRDRVDSTATLLLRGDFMNEAVQAEALLIHSLSQDDGVLQGSVSYEWRSNIRFKLGVDIFYGDAQGLFGQFQKSDRVSISAEVGF